MMTQAQRFHIILLSAVSVVQRRIIIQKNQNDCMQFYNTYLSIQ